LTTDINIVIISVPWDGKTGAPPTLGALVKRADVIATGKRNQYLNRYAFGVSIFNLAFRRKL